MSWKGSQKEHVQHWDYVLFGPLSLKRCTIPSVDVLFGAFGLHRNTCHNTIMQHFNLKGLQNGPPQVCPEPSKTQLLGLFSGTSWGPFWGGRTGLGTADKALSCTPQTNRVFICCECAALYTRCRVVPSPLTPLLCAVQPCVCTSAYNRLLCFIWWV